MISRPLQLEELVEHFTLAASELELLRGKGGATRLGFGLILKFLLWKGRFPEGLGELPDNAIGHIARQVGVPAAEIGSYDWSGRQIKRHRVEIRRALGFRECSVAEAKTLTDWLTRHVTCSERRPDRVRDELLLRCRAEQIEPPERTRIERIVRSALHQAEETLIAQIVSRLGADAVMRLEVLLAVGENKPGGEDTRGVLGTIKTDPGRVSLATMLDEINKLQASRAIGLPPGLFADVAPKVVTAWRARAVAESPSHLREHPPSTRRTMLAALVWQREREIADTLVELLISVVHLINARAEKRVTQELINELKRVRGKENILFRLAEAAVEHPDDIVREAVYPVVGEDTLNDLVSEYKASGPTYRRTVQTTLKASYTNHYRHGLIKLLEVLGFESANIAHRPVIDAIALVRRYAGRPERYYPTGEHVPVDGVVAEAWRDPLYRVDNRGRERIVRAVYEVCVFSALRDRLRCKEIWVIGADKWRNPEQDLPADFDEHRIEHYASLDRPLDPAAFIAELQGEMRTELGLLNNQLPGLTWVDIAERTTGAIRLTPLDAVPEPKNLRRLKAEVARRWGVVHLLDILKEADLRIAFTPEFTPVGTREVLDRAVLQQRLLLAIYAYGTDTGLRRIAQGEHGHSEDDLRYVRSRYMNLGAGRQAAARIANATFAARQANIWGHGTTAVASDSTHFGSYDQNIFTEWHVRYGGRGVLIYWHVERHAMAVYSQLLSCSASEVAAMVEGAIRHGTDIDVDANYVDSHGQSEIGFGINRLLALACCPGSSGSTRSSSTGLPPASPTPTPGLARR